MGPGATVSFQFLGPDSYASPDLYPGPHLPGWLYVTVRGDGQVTEWLGDPELREMLVRSTNAFGEKQQRFALDANDVRVDAFLPGIRGFRILVTRLEAIAKLAQDKGRVDSRIATDFLANKTNLDSLPLFEMLLKEARFRE